MDWLKEFTGSDIASAVIIIALTIAIGLLLNRIKFGSISLGVTWVLFVGIILSHFGFTVDHDICHFVKEFGLILFVTSVGYIAGPKFFGNFKKNFKSYVVLALVVIVSGGLASALCFYLGKVTGGMGAAMGGMGGLF